MSAARLPTVDMRALALSAAAASPLFAWQIVDTLSDDPWPAASIPLATQLSAVLYAINSAFGHVFVALGTVLALQRDPAALQARSFRRNAIAVAVLLSTIFALPLALALADGYAYLARAGLWSQQLAELVLGTVTPPAAVAVAAHLYVNWRREPPDQRDGARFLAFTALGLALALAFYLSSMIGSVPRTLASDITLLPFLLWLVQVAATRVVDDIGIVFLFGSIAVACLRRANVEDRLGWVTAAMFGASLSYWLLDYGPSYLRMRPFLTHEDTVWSEPNLFALLVCALFGLVSGPVYLFAVNREALRRALADVPRSIGELRRWPSQPTDD